ncbi:MutS-related protein [Pseudobacter ginsenosidimutans]|uniref:MutS-like protein n=1 Tax=Pseudobacter ginsenosidimutans TaxID=661488 RepID=A0A4Q7MK50_9BACT|nr:DNA mismatch repair protein [Pseudobacter ginsenosidimutans]QEC45594.1 DNA mismatch repair protein [Pseudobacter ginsenosidimutans]RZS67142.1 MutS-like protein [Pseudobacter ginsenosidimutans]
MQFNTDKQTIEELNLLAKFRQGSVYHLFNRVRTRGGEQLLDNMFRYPLTDAVAINDRSSIFRFHQNARLAFPFDVQQVNLMQEYLDSGTSRNTVLVWGRTVLKKLLSSLTRDERYKKMVQGLQATIVTLNKCYIFVNSMPHPEFPYAERVSAIKAILSDKLIERLYNTDIYQALPLQLLAMYDHLLKGRLHEQLEDILAFIYESDVHIAVSEVALDKGFGYAKALSAPENVFMAEGLRHPNLDGAVGNNLLLDKNSNMIFLTGANMAGKSTLMKSVGIGMYLAHMGFPVAASRLEFSVREGMYSSINVADNIGLGYSHFYAEVVRVKQAAEAAASGKSLLLMFDELFKGTNVKDAYDGTLAVIEGFADYTQCLFIVSTHIIEVGASLEGLHNIQFRYMPTIMDGHRPQYPYQLKEGVTEDRQGMMIIRNEGVLELLEQ